MSRSSLSILLTGASGYVGSYLQPRLEAVGNRRVGVLAADVTAPDLEVPPADVVIHLAGRLNSFAGAESEIERVNHGGTANLARRCRRGTHLVFLSTRSGVRERSGAHLHRDRHGRARDGLRALEGGGGGVPARHLERVTILRTSVLYGYSHPGRRNTVEFIESKLRAGEPIDLFSDVFACPTYIGDLAACVERAIAEGVYGIHHACGAEFVSRCDIAEALCVARGYARELIRPVPRPASVNVPRWIHLRQSGAMRDLLSTRLADHLLLDGSAASSPEASPSVVP